MIKILLATHVLTGYGSKRVPAADPQYRDTLFAWAKRHGFDGIEVGSWWFDPAIADRNSVFRLQNEIARHQLELAGFNLLRKNITHPAVREDNRRGILSAIARAGEAGLRFVSISLSIPPAAVGVAEDRIRGLGRSPGSSREASPAEFVEAAAFLREAADQAADVGVELSLELHHCSLADNSSALMRLLTLADHPNLFANPDLCNVLWSYDQPEEDWFDALERLAPRAKVWHVKNVQRIAVPEVGRATFVQTALDAGDVDYRWAVARMIEHGFAGDISIEGAGPGDFLAFAARGIAYLRGLLAEVESGAGLRVQ